MDVERHHDRDPELEQLDGEVQVPLEVRRVHHVQHEIRALAREVLAGDDLLLAVGGHRVDAGEVHEPDPRAAMLERRLLLLDRHPGPVADLESRPGDRVDEGGLPAVRVARHRDGEDGRGHGRADHLELPRGGHGATSTAIASASLFRSDRL